MELSIDIWNRDFYNFIWMNQHLISLPEAVWMVWLAKAFTLQYKGVTRIRDINICICICLCYKWLAELPNPFPYTTNLQQTTINSCRQTKMISDKLEVCNFFFFCHNVFWKIVCCRCIKRRLWEGKGYTRIMLS